jgi:biopolymer transport protein ExbB/TolQ
MAWPIIVEWLARLVFLLLIGLSVWSISVIIDRRRFFKVMHSLPFAQIQEALLQGKSVSGFQQQDALTGRLLLQMQRDQSHYKIFSARERKAMEHGLGVLGTLGPISPFIGLLGTILGIIVSFAKLSQGGGGTNAVMFSLAEALVLTAVGLIVAIPSVVAFNFFNRQIKSIFRELDIIVELWPKGNKP